MFQEGFLWVSSLAASGHLPWTIPGSDTPIPNPLLPVLTALTQLGIQRMMTPPTMDPQQAQMNKAMQFMPIMFLFFSFNFPAGLVLYWVTSNLVSFVQQYFFTGWGGLFPGGYTPKTPFAGSAAGRPAGVRAEQQPGLDDDDEPPAESQGRGRERWRGPRRAGGSGPGQRPRLAAAGQGEEDAVRSVESHGKTVDEAIGQALRRLGRQRDEVEVTVLSEGSRGVFGIGAEEARVRVTAARGRGEAAATRPPKQAAVPMERLPEVAARTRSPTCSS